MARAGLGEAWDCLFANDIDAKKRASYAANWGARRSLRTVRVMRQTAGGCGIAGSPPSYSMGMSASRNRKVVYALERPLAEMAAVR
jgi:site-specific DNA-cytosine methylase